MTDKHELGRNTLLTARRQPVVPSMNRRLLFIALAGWAFTACGGGGSNTPSASNNPSTTVITVDYANAPLAGVKVTLSSGLNNQTPTGIIATGATNAQGQVTFSLPASGTVCVSAVETTNGGTAFAGNCPAQPFPSTYNLSLDS